VKVVYGYDDGNKCCWWWCPSLQEWANE
jgi:hypothetical protein